MKNKILLTNWCFLILIIIFDILYISPIGNIYIKAIASSLFVILGLINLLYLKKIGNLKTFYPFAMVVSLFIACLGDVLLMINFIVGAITFALGQIALFFSYSLLEKVKLRDLIIAVAFFIPACSIIVFLPIFDYGGVLMKSICAVYSFVISCMLAKSISNFILNKSKQNLIILIGSGLFSFSDFMILFNYFSTIQPAILGLSVFGTLCLATYYPGEFMLAHSVIYTETGKFDKK